jgi:hypothetical protein
VLVEISDDRAHTLDFVSLPRYALAPARPDGSRAAS